METRKTYIIAVDGHSSCGKSTFAKEIARELDFLYIDSGAMYRSVALYCLEKGIFHEGRFDLDMLVKDLPDLVIDFRKNLSTGHQETYLNNRNVEEEIRSVKVSEVVSQLSQIKVVREQMVKLQRHMSQSGPDHINKGVVMDGRDIGTVVFPRADLKIFMTADPDIRAGRRYDELLAKGTRVQYDDIRNNVIKRDHEDETRMESPLRKAADAVVLDNSHMTVKEQMEWFREIWDQKLHSHDH